jgi:hypothetical protein
MAALLAGMSGLSLRARPCGLSSRAAVRGEPVVLRGASSRPLPRARAPRSGGAGRGGWRVWQLPNGARTRACARRRPAKQPVEGFRLAAAAFSAPDRRTAFSRAAASATAASGRGAVGFQVVAKQNAKKRVRQVKPYRASATGAQRPDAPRRAVGEGAHVQQVQEVGGCDAHQEGACRKHVERQKVLTCFCLRCWWRWRRPRLAGAARRR